MLSVTEAVDARVPPLVAVLDGPSLGKQEVARASKRPTIAMRDRHFVLEVGDPVEQPVELTHVSLYGAGINGSNNMNRIVLRDVELGDARVTGQLICTMLRSKA